MRLFTVFDNRDLFHGAAGGGAACDASAAPTDDDLASMPRHAEHFIHAADRHGGAAINCDALDGPVRREESQRLAVR